MPALYPIGTNGIQLAGDNFRFAGGYLRILNKDTSLGYPWVIVGDPGYEQIDVGTPALELTGYGYPQGCVTANQKASYLDTKSNTLWFKETGSDAFGWTQVIYAPVIGINYSLASGYLRWLNVDTSLNYPLTITGDLGQEQINTGTGGS